MSKTSVLIIEDEAAIRDMIRFGLEDEDFQLQLAADTPEAEKILLTDIPDIILLDWMLPGKSGIDFMAWLNAQAKLKHIPVIMLTAKAEEENKIRGLMAGADDYITKPFSPNELIARIKTVLRRGPLRSNEQELRYKELVLNVEKAMAMIGQHKLDLSANEYKMLHFFMKNPNKTFSRSQLITFLHGSHVYIEERSIDSQVRRLRDKLKAYQYQDLIQTVRGIGYICVVES